MLEVVAPKWRGLRVVPTRAAARELDRLHFTVHDAIEVLEEGYDCARSKRKKNVLEKCVKKGNKTIKIVVARCYNSFLKKEAWLIIHAGKFK
ncbi:MAG: hypothetical protein KAW41_04600 [Candidatus Diapherotrites archaeon]|nr:hypothetical protein [Candidatus Diapherotrites archaeon]